MDISALTLFDGYRVVLAFTGLASIAYSVRRGYLMYQQYQNLPEFIKRGIREGSIQSVSSFLKNEKWEITQITLLIVTLLGLYYVFWNL
jgi:hypothetical protein